ncbi:hypothetical protein EW026_g514 [Hermanssonia centrifuga]|uniref:Uncharacterized protein n=1 Tax=Hermanssonia centrifuga TaxID=98765 RepID=A0A4S4KW54_9APHY|nr:hypothetical protein EW026_g514 [Hermanssonia centrifuga]
MILQRPFNFGSHIPTDEEVSQVADDIQSECIHFLGDEYLKDNTQNYLANLLRGASDECEIAGSRPESDWLQDDERIRSAYEDNQEFVLTAAERRHVYCRAEPEYGGSDSGHEDMQEPEVSERKRSKMYHDVPALPDVLAQDLKHNESEHCECPSISEDSGIYIENYIEEDHMQPEPSKRFGSHFIQLAHDAQGFEGPEADGNILPDVDSVHFDHVWGVSSGYEAEPPVPFDLEDLRLAGFDDATVSRPLCFEPAIDPISPPEEENVIGHQIGERFST